MFLNDKGEILVGFEVGEGVMSEQACERAPFIRELIILVIDDIFCLPTAT